MHKFNSISALFKRCKPLFLLFFILFFLHEKSSGQVLIKVSGIPDSRGQLLYSLFRSADGFPGDPQQAYKKGAVKVTASSIQYSIDLLPPGEYALSLVHDRNENGLLDMNSLGIPTEAIGFSNNVMGAFGPPKFSRAKFTIMNGKQTALEIRLRKFP